MGRPPTNYSDTQKSAALIAYDICDNNAVRAAQWCKEHNGFTVSHDQIMRWANGIQIAEEVREFAQVKKGELADKFEQIAHLCTDLAAEKLQSKNEYIPFEKLMTGGAIATDKMRLLREQSTVNIAATLSPEQRWQRMNEIFEEAQKRIEGEVVEVESEEKIDE